ncbi:hypothetical protein [Brumicola pallidula]|jgi:hypothetical protein|uniref:Uncharacterized protein n=1 Tax=Brumicola pallidula DSM 14239 = ACAM 615 TaxID=1121922 RepID=K6YDA3_9ALTE|nr:hypothetical protein [Glaciecola pallidula]GAC30724.1 hypothetical protein GPAL_3884 [Glaciecola pallidula DSM 14239 = ACAM 615]
MNKPTKIIAMLLAFAGIAFLVHIAGELALSGKPLIAILPVGVVLCVILLYIKFSDKKN